MVEAHCYIVITSELLIMIDLPDEELSGCREEPFSPRTDIH